jgi:eukaryotic-like serine/threonine-protein kinase
MSNKKFERFGKYLILDHLVDGGMAKICRARYLGEQSNKIVAIKMVQPQFSKDPSFNRMFQDELSVTFGLQHPNIAQTYDYGKVNDQLYTAMEYVDGANLKQFLDRLKEKRYVFPVEISVYIISQVCQGLHYAHTFTDKLSNKPLNIIHRDISPHNVMLTYDGAVKVIDFGIAKSNASSEATQAGTIKGKLSYLAPEYLDGMELDARYDQFAVGITLWEMLCSRKLFSASNDLATLKLIQNCKITPPSQINPNVSIELDHIVMKALSKDRSLRFDNLDKMNRALVKFLYSNFPDFNSSDLSYFARELFKDEIKRDKEKFVEYGKIDLDPYIEEMNKKYNKTRTNITDHAETVELKKDRDKKVNVSEAEKIEANKPILPPLPEKVDHKQDKKTPKIDEENKDKKPLRLEIESVQESHTRALALRKTRVDKSGVTRMGKTRHKSLEIEETEKSSFGKIILIFVASISFFAYLKPELIEKFVGIDVRKYLGGAPERNVSSIDPAPVVEDTSQYKGKLLLRGFEQDMELFIDGSKKEYRTGKVMLLPADRDITLLIKKPGHKSFLKNFKLPDNGQIAALTIPPFVKAKVGLLSSSLNYEEGTYMKLKIDGEEVKQSMPFKDISIPEGKYQALIVNPVLGVEKKVKFQIEENKIHFLE